MDDDASVTRRRILAAAGLGAVVWPLQGAWAATATHAEGEHAALPLAWAAPRFPLRVASGKRHLVDANGHPFLIHGDSAWSLLVRPGLEQAADYLEDRHRRGFNAVLVNLLEHEFADSPPKNRYGDAPFLNTGDFSTPNERYFVHADAVIAKAEALGILVMLAPAYLGFGGGSEGWYHEMRANGPARLQAYGRYVARRLNKRSNIVWVLGGDYNPPEKDLLKALVAGIREVDGNALMTFHGGRGTSATDFLGTSEPWLQLSNIYTNEHNVVEKALAEFKRTPKPFFLIEGRYEWADGEASDAHMVRVQAYQATFSGACGQVMGNWAIWQFGSGWERAMGSNASATIIYLRALLESLPWNRLVPDIDHRLLTKGLQSDETRAAAALTDDATLGVIYIPSPREITVDLARLNGQQVRTRWFDPCNGHSEDATAAPLTATGTHTFAREKRNGGLDWDWVLLLEAQKVR